MKANSVNRDSMLLMAGLASIAVLGAVALINYTGELPEQLSDSESYDGHRLLMVAEYSRLSDQWQLAPDVTIAIGSGLSESAATVLQRFGHPWIRQQSWENNRGVPPPGTMLVKELRLDGDTGVVAVVIGEIAGDEACGYNIDSRYTWRGGWTVPDSGRVVMC